MNIGNIRLSVGKNTAISAENFDGLFPELVTVGSNCVVAPRAVILAHDASRLPFSGEYVVARTTVGNNVFIGFGAVIMPGVTVGDRCVIGANAVVTKDVEPNSVMVGSPARRVCSVDEMLAKEKPTVTPPFTMETLTRENYDAFRKQVLNDPRYSR